MHVYFLQSPTGGGDFNINATTADPHARKLTNSPFKGKVALLEAVFRSHLSLVYYTGTAASCDSSTSRANTNRKINY